MKDKYIRMDRSTNTRAIYLAYGRDATGEPCFSYIRIPITRMGAFKEACGSGKVINLMEFGNIILTGTGEPTPEIHQYILKKLS